MPRNKKKIDASARRLLLSLPEAVMAFVEEHWGEVGAIAFKHFLLEGRGLLLAEMKDVWRGREGPEARVRLQYIVESQAAGAAGADAVALVQQYDPERQCVFVVQTADGWRQACLYTPADNLPVPLACYLATPGAAAKLPHFMSN